MKRKLALLLAVSMILSMVPMNMSLFASSTNNLSKVPTVTSERPAFVESDLMPAVLRTTAVEIVKNDDDSIKSVVDGTYLQIQPDGTITSDSTIKLQLENARWLFTEGVTTSGAKWNGIITGSAITAVGGIASSLTDEMLSSTTNRDRQLGYTSNVFNLYRTWRKYTTNNVNPLSGATVPDSISLGTVVPEAVGSAQEQQIARYGSNVYVRYGAVINAAPAAAVAGSGATTTAVAFSASTGTVYRTAGTTGGVTLSGTTKGTHWDYDDFGNTRIIVYKMTMSGADVKVATIEFPNAIEGVTSSDTTHFDTLTNYRNKIIVPLVVRGTTDDASDIKVTIIDNNLTTVSGGSWVFGTVSDTLTNTYVDDPKTGRDEFPLNRIVIKEQRVGSMGSGTIRITAPNGFEFASDALKNIRIYAENFGYGTSKIIYGPGQDSDVPANNATIGFRTSRGETDYSVIEVEFLNLSYYKSSKVAGSMYITGNYNDPTLFKLVADENASFGDVMLKITNGSGDDVVTEQSFKAGTRKDWTIDFQALGTIPTLVNGRYYQDDSLYAEDEEHLTATIKFYENTVNSWWSGRYTDFTLPEGVKIRKAEITKAKYVIQEDELRNDRRTSTYNEDYYVNTSKKDGYVTITGNVLSMNNLQVKSDEKAQIEMKLWISIASGYEGDVTLTATGSGVPDELDPIVIAKAVNPVDINTTVTDVRIGYQYYQVADIELVETGAGMLEKNKQVWLTVTDRINMDMYFTPGFKWEVTEGNIKIKNVDLGSGTKITVSNKRITNSSAGDLGSGTIVFDVDGTSSTASTIKFSNLQLKIDRTVPESSQEHYSVYAWGPNVAPNADIFDYSSIYSSSDSNYSGHQKYVGNDQHTSLGIHVPFVRVVTSAIDKNNILSSVVKITAGSTTAYVNGDAVTVDPAPFIDAATSRFQVPVRAIATLLGIREEQILWSDADRTVTINMVNRTIQFAIGSDLMLVNGAQVRMDTAAMIVNGRTFIPFKYLGDALGVTVGYDDATKTATYNDAE